MSKLHEEIIDISDYEKKETEELFRMSLNQYIKNPSGKGATYASSSIISDALEKRYNSLLVKKKFTYKVAKTSKGIIYILLKIPSETVDMYYDILLEFTEDDKSDKRTIKNHKLRVFSNCPSFVFTYAYAFSVNGMFIEPFSKFVNIAVSEEASTKNPYSIVGYEKSIYYACRFIQDNLCNITQLDILSKGVKLKTLIDGIKTIEEVLEEHNKKKKLLNIKNKNKSKIAKSIKRTSDKKRNMINSQSSVKFNKADPKRKEKITGTKSNITKNSKPKRKAPVKKITGKR